MSAAISVLQQMLERIGSVEGLVPNDGSHLAELREQMLDELAGYARHATEQERSHRRKAAVAYKPKTPGFGRSARVRPALAARLVGVDGPIRGSSFELSSETIIGRSTLSDIVISDADLGRSHARIQFLDDHYLLVDLGSAHGTSVNGQAVESARLVDGDQVQLGQALFRFELGDRQMSLSGVR